jgi:flagellar biosynthetic protein FliQ
LGADHALSLVTHMLWTGAITLTPLLGVILIVGILISVIQVATQIQEMTLSYVPKLIATGLMLMFAGGWMMGQIVHFSRDMLASIPSLAH